MAAAIGQASGHRASGIWCDIAGNDGSGGHLSVGDCHQPVSPAAGDKMDEAILQYVKRKYNLLIGERNRRADQNQRRECLPRREASECRGEGEGSCDGHPKTVEITSEEVRETLAESIDTIIDTFRSHSKDPPELAADIVEQRDRAVGGGALLRNLDILLRQVTSLPIKIAEDRSRQSFWEQERFWITRSCFKK